MSTRNFASGLAMTLQFEGGFANHPIDPGGATKYGITRKVLAEWRGRSVSIADVRALTRSEVEAIYRRLYWETVGGDELPGGVDVAVFDLAVNSGVGRASRTLQQAVGAVPDGIVGVDTVRAARALPADALVRLICTARRSFLQKLRIFPTFGRGWLRRVDAIEALGLSLAGRETVQSKTAKKETMPMLLTKTMLESRTVWANLIGLAALVGDVWGLNTGAIDQSALVDAVLKVTSGLSFVASTVFRIRATRLIG
ncbi:MAG: hypothetical protein LCH61_02125 [Proteobacteria bacterium]|nr:hypothetical protein [Pseudomonadota bacterium]